MGVGSAISGRNQDRGNYPIGELEEYSMSISVTNTPDGIGAGMPVALTHYSVFSINK